MEYKFTFYDVDTGVLRTITGLVDNVWGDQIKIKYIPNSDTVNCSVCKFKFTCDKAKAKNKKEGIYGAESPMPTCNCILNPPTSLDKYDGPVTFFIPIQNLVNVVYTTTKSNISNDEKWRTKVMLLGITATTVKAIVVRLGFIDDSLEDAIKYVDLQVGGIYNLAYEVKEGCSTTTYENKVKIISIDEIPERPIHSTKSFVREEVGMNGSVYTNCCWSDKDKFMTSKPVRPIKITVDTSEVFDGNYETIMLDSIRDCTLIEPPEDLGSQIPDTPSEDKVCACCTHKHKGCNPHNCGHRPPPELRPNVFDFGAGKKVYLSADGKVAYHNNGCKGTANIEELIKFYFGIN